MDLEKILKVAVRGGASDILLKTGSLPRFRYQGNLVTLADGQAIQASVMQSWVDKLLPSSLQQHLREHGDADFAYQSQAGYRFRVNVFRQQQSYGLALRVLPVQVRSIEELQLPSLLGELSEERRGLVLVTGATGSGKSTTMAAMLQKINTSRPAHIITIEDPIELQFKDEQATINQREIGSDTASFARALRAALRQNPDVLMVGELRDEETTSTALMAAETGHLVLSTLHTSDAVEGLSRLLAYFPAHQHAYVRQMLAHSLRAIVSQRLLPRADGKGLIAAMEILTVHASVREVILKSTSFASLYGLFSSGSETYGTLSFDDSILSLYQQGLITREVALMQATNSSNLELKLRGVGA